MDDALASHMAQEITVDLPTGQIVVDGFRLPWFIGLDVEVQSEPQGVPGLRLMIMAEKVTTLTSAPHALTQA